MPSQVKTFALLTGLRGAASIRLRPPGQDICSLNWSPRSSLHQTATSAKVSIQCKEKEPVRVAFDVQRPTGFSAFTK